DDETPADKGFVPIGSGNVIQVAGAGSLSGFGQTCSIFESGDVRCWGYGGFGALGYGNTNDIGDDEFPSTAGSVTVGGDVSQLDVGARHTCAVLTSGDVRCWGTGAQELGYVSSQTMTIGDDEVPATAGSVDVGGKAVQVAVSSYHTCVLLEVGDVRCWGTNYDGELGTGNLPPNKCYDDNNGFHCTYHPECCIGDFEAPGDVEVVDIGGVVTQIAAGNGFTCALLESGQVRCWGKNSNGQLGYGHTMNIGDDEPPASAGDVPLGGIAIQIASGDDHSCAVMETGAVRCWGFGFSGKLGYGNLGTESSLCGGNVIGQFKCDKNSVCCVGDDETPASAGDVPLGEKAIEVAVANASILDSGKITCVLLESGQVRCWGGHLGYGAGYVIIGDDETPEENPNGYIPLF
ncbi:MAG: RCC1 domain-containing protein, partial [Nannocystaceae bacterium]